MRIGTIFLLCLAMALAITGVFVAHAAGGSAEGNMDAVTSVAVSGQVPPLHATLSYFPLSGPEPGRTLAKAVTR